MNAKITKSIVSLCLTALLTFVSPSVFAEAGSTTPALHPGNQADAAVKNKEEVIYAALDSDGSTKAIYAVNHFEVTGAGNITDYGEYSSVQNLTSTDPISQNDDHIAFYAGKGNFYYQGNMASTDLPWKFDLSYHLDGVQTAPKDLAGKSGKLEIYIRTRQNPKINPAFYQNYMLQISLTLDTGNCDDIVASGATLADSGKNTVITYMVMPGKDGDFSLSSTVRDFVMDGIQISAMPLKLGIEMPDTNEMTDKLTTLSDAISDLNGGVKKLKNGVGDLKKGAKQLVKGSTDFDDGLSQLSGNSDHLTQVSGQINSALAEIVTALSSPSDGTDLSALTQLPDGLDQLAQGLAGITGGLTQLKPGFADAYNALDSAISGIEDISPADIEALSASPGIAGLDDDQKNTFDQLLTAYTAAQTVKATYNGPNGNDGVKVAFEAVKTSLDTIPGSIDAIAQNISKMSAEIKNADIADQMQQLIDGLTELADNYGQFDSGLIQYTGGVKELPSNYGKLHSGLVSLSNGTQDLYTGTSKLYSGTNELNDNTADMPQNMQTQIDDMMKDYDKSDFKSISFVSEKNTNVSLVQFVLKTTDIKLKQESIPAEPGTQPTTLWERFLALFS